MCRLIGLSSTIRIRRRLALVLESSEEDSAAELFGGIAWKGSPEGSGVMGGVGGHECGVAVMASGVVG